MTLHRYIRVLLLIGLVTSVVAGGCVLFGTPPGEPCETSGDGFTRTDPCSTDCMDFEGTCPDGRVVTPNQCIFSECEPEVTDCGSGQVCVLAGVASGYCVEADLCP